MTLREEMAKALWEFNTVTAFEEMDNEVKEEMRGGADAVLALFREEVEGLPLVKPNQLDTVWEEQNEKWASTNLTRRQVFHFMALEVLESYRQGVLELVKEEGK